MADTKHQNLNNYRRWLGYVSKHTRLLLLSFGAILSVIAVEVSIPKLVTWVIDDILSGSIVEDGVVVVPLLGGVSITTLFVMVFVFLVIAVLWRASMQYARTVLLTHVGEEVHFEIRSALFERLQQLPVSYFDKSYTGRIMARITTDADALWVLIFEGMQSLVAPGLLLVIVLILVSLSSVWMALILLLVVPLFYLAYSKARNKVFRAGRLQRESLSHIYSVLHEQISGIRIVRAYGRSIDERFHFSVALRKLYNRNMLAMRAVGGLVARGDLLVGVGTALLLCAGGIAASNGHITVGQLVQFYAYAGLVFVPIQTIANTTGRTFSMAEVAMERIFALLDQAPAPEFSGQKQCPNLAGAIALSQVSFEYNSGIPVIRNVSLSIKPRRLTALVGPSGAGKTTLVNLICRLYDPKKGSIMVDDQKITDLEVESYRSQISYVSQDNFLFSGSVAENISYSMPRASRDQIIDAARLANADGFIAELPQGYDTVLGERGVNLSAGQRQRINFARALVRKPNILILDEPTNALDAESETAIFDALNSLFKGITRIVIAHRIATVMNADSIFVVDHGGIAQSGTHRDLVATEGIYRNLCLKQFVAIASPISDPERAGPIELS